MPENKSNWTPIPKPHPRRLCLLAYNKASGTEYALTKKAEWDEAVEAIIAEVRAVLAAPTAKDAVDFLNGPEDVWGADPPRDVWESEWRRETSPLQMAKAVRAAYRELAGLEAV